LVNTFNFFTKKNLFAAAFFILLAALLYLLFSLLQPFLPSFPWALILSMVFYPVYARLLSWTGGRSNTAALLTTLGVLILLALPGFIILVNLGQEVGKTYETLSTMEWQQKTKWLMSQIQAIGLQEYLTKWGIEPGEVERVLQDAVTSAIQGFNQYVLSKLSSLFRNLAAFVALVFFVVVCLFFFFRDGAQYALKVVELLPLSDDHRGVVVDRFAKTVSSVVRAMFLTALVQGVMTGVGFAAAGVPLPVLFGVVAAVNSFIPFLGAASVWIPGALWLITQDHMMPGLLLAAWGCLISTVDNVIKPLIIGGEARLPIFLIFFTILGGLKLYGFLGVFLGPIILSMGLAFLSIYRDLYVKGNTGAVVKRGRWKARA
jgi:predicted PurR-regulated permease PerM